MALDMGKINKKERTMERHTLGEAGNKLYLVLTHCGKGDKKDVRTNQFVSPDSPHIKLFCYVC